MESSKQIIIFSTSQDQPFTLSAIDLQTGTTLSVYKDGGVANKNCVIISNDKQYLVSSEKEKARIHIWHLNKKNSFHKTIISPGVINALEISSCSNYLLAAINSKILIWQLANGNLITVLERHFQNITCLKCSDDGYYFVSASKDGHCLIWEFGEIFSHYSNRLFQGLTEGINEPKFSLTDHQNEITSVYCGNLLTNSRCYTSSLDCSCKVYNVLSGELIANIIFESPLYSLAVDKAELNLFVGAENGKVYQTRLYQEIDDFTSTIMNSKPEFSGHTNKVTSLSVSSDGLCLVSASTDCKIKKWHIPSKNCMDTYTHKASISNCFIINTPNGILYNSSNSLEYFHNLKKEVSNQLRDDLNDGSIEIKLNNNFMLKTCLEKEKNIKTIVKNMNQEDNNNKDEIAKLKKINNLLYQYNLEQVYKS